MRPQSIIRHLSLRTVATSYGRQFPTTVTPETPLRDLPIAEAVYHRYNGGNVPARTLSLVLEAMRDSAAVVVAYHDVKGELTARVLWPSSVTLTKDNQITAWCYCTLRRTWKSFRLDRIQSIHPLTTPDDAEDVSVSIRVMSPLPSCEGAVAHAA